MSPPRSTKWIQSSNTPYRIEAWLYTSASRVSGSTPLVILGHGIGAVKAGGLSPFANAFVAHGYAALSFDYLSFGGSEGEPRNVVNVDQELRDFRDVIAWARNEEAFDPQRIVVWGSSFGGMHITALMTLDHNLAGGIAQCPCVDGFGASMEAPMLRSLRMTTWALIDYLASFFSKTPIYITTAPIPKTPPNTLTILDAPDVLEGWQRIMPEDGRPFINHIASRSLFSIIQHRPNLHVHKSIKPLLIMAPTYDSVAPLKAAEQVAKDAPLGELVRLPGGHFDVYAGGIAFEENIKAQMEFLHRVAPVS